MEPLIIFSFQSPHTFFLIIASYFFYFLVFTFWLHQAACGILVPRPGIEPEPAAVAVPSPNHLTGREFPPPPTFLMLNANNYVSPMLSNSLTEF